MSEFWKGYFVCLVAVAIMYVGVNIDGWVRPSIPEVINHDHSECEMQVGLLEDEIAQQHRDNDRLRQWLLGDLLSDGRLPPIEGLIDE